MAAILQISLVSLVILSLLYIASFYLIAKKDDNEKLSPYECGFEPFGDARMKVSILYWIIGILYLIFDLEIIFIFPFASIMYSLNSLFALWAIMLFLLILTLGFIYEYQQGALEIVWIYILPISIPIPPPPPEWGGGSHQSISTISTISTISAVWGDWGDPK